MIMSAETQPKKRRRVSACVGCGSAIQDQFILRVAPDLEWHAACLKCADCNQFLDETCTCFVRDGKTYCKRDYVRLFGTKCGKCNQGFNKNEFVMRVKAGVFHIECFRCVACSRQLIPGDEFALREDGLFCKADHEVVERAQQNGETIPPHNNNNDPRLSAGIQLSTAGHVEQLHQSPNSNTRHRTGGERIRSHVHKSDTKTTRVRTVLNEKQLHTLRTCYNANPRPDALMKEQLTEMTSLSPRVIRVWFQNKRCKDKKRSILMKQMQDQQQKNGNRLQGPLTGVPMVASSPVRHESPMQVHPVEVQGYTQATPWKELNYGMDVDSGHFQSLMVDSFDDGDGLSGGQYLSGDDSNMRAPSSMSSDEVIETIHSEMSSPNSS